MARRADAGRSGASRGREKASPRDVGEPAGQMKNKNVSQSPQRAADRVLTGKANSGTPTGRGKGR